MTKMTLMTGTSMVTGMTRMTVMYRVTQMTRTIKVTWKKFPKLLLTDLFEYWPNKDLSN